MEVVEEVFREHLGYHGPSDGQGGPLNCGPGKTRTYSMCLHGSDLVVEVDQLDGQPGQVWDYHVHSLDDPWSWLALSVEQLVHNLAFLAERGWISVSEGSIVRTRAEDEEDPRMLADLRSLGLGHLPFHPV